MNVNKAKQLFEEIVELCYESGNPRIIEVVDSIYDEVDSADELYRIIISLEELLLAINEEEFLPEEEDSVSEIREKIELLSE